MRLPNKQWRKNNSQAGFTLLELMIATTIFSVILLLCTYGLVQVGRTYYKGITQTRTQQATSNIMDTITQGIQFGAAEPGGQLPPSTGSGTFCLGSSQFQYAIGQIPQPGVPALVMSRGCGAATTEPRELLGENMRLTQFSIEKVDGVYVVRLKVTHADNSSTDPLFDNNSSSPTYGDCTGKAGSQFCASSRLETTVYRRL